MAAPDQQHLTITQQQISVVAALFLITAFVTYLVGRASVQLAVHNPGVLASCAVWEEPELIHVMTKGQGGPETQADVTPGKVYYAVLGRFGTLEKASAYYHTLKKNALKGFLKKVVSRSRAGKERILYEIVTAHCADKQELEKNIEQIKKVFNHSTHVMSTIIELPLKQNLEKGAEL